MGIDVAAPDSELTPVSDAEEEADQADDRDEPDDRIAATRIALVAVSLIVVALAGLVAWQLHQVSNVRKLGQERALYLEVAKQGALNLTTIAFTTVDSDIARILDSSTGAFHDDFEQRSQPFIDVVKQARSASVGSITDAGLVSVDADGASAIVAVTVKTSDAAAAEQEPRSWRMRILVERVDSGAKVSNVEFVP